MKHLLSALIICALSVQVYAQKHYQLLAAKAIEQTASQGQHIGGMETKADQGDTCTSLNLNSYSPYLINDRVSVYLCTPTSVDVTARVVDANDSLIYNAVYALDAGENTLPFNFVHQKPSAYTFSFKTATDSVGFTANKKGRVGTTSHHVSLEGTADGAGTIDDPVDLASILLNRSTNINLNAGDTILIHEGRYRGTFTVWMGGLENYPVVVMPYKDDLVLIDGYAPEIESDQHSIMYVTNNYIVFRDLHFTSTNPNRVSSETGSFPQDIDWRGGIDLQGNNLDVINCYFYDLLGGGIGSWRNGGVMYGNILWYNGWDATDRGHGHSFYLQNADVNNPKFVENNISHTGFMYGIKIYTTNTSIKGFSVKDNICFNAANLSAEGPNKDAGRNIFVGGFQGAEEIVVDSNFTYKSEDWGVTKKAPCMTLGWHDANQDIKARGNYMVGGNRTFTIEKWENADIQYNTIVTRDKSSEPVRNDRDYVLSYKEAPNMNNVTINNNQYFMGKNATPMQITSEKLTGWVTHEQWQDSLSFDANSTFTRGLPTSNVVKVIPNIYEAGRAHIVIYNWENIETVAIEVEDVLKSGDTYYLYDSENMLAGHVQSGVYTGGTINVPMNLSTVTQPVGNAPVEVFHTPIEFGAYLLTTKPLRTKICAIDFESVSPEVVHTTMDLNFSLTGECTLADLTILNESNEVVYTQKDVAPGGSINFAEACPNCQGGTYQAIVESDYLQDSVNFTFEKDITNINTNLLSNVSCTPNPTTGEVLVNFGTDMNHTVTLEVLNHLGQVVYNTTTGVEGSTLSLDIPGLAGIYFVRVNNGTDTHVVKVIKK